MSFLVDALAVTSLFCTVTVFDKVFADDTDHVRGFANFSRFRKFEELGNVLEGLVPGRENDRERILSYNIGLGLHDAYFAYRIYSLITA